MLLLVLFDSAERYADAASSNFQTRDLGALDHAIDSRKRNGPTLRECRRTDVSSIARVLWSSGLLSLSCAGASHLRRTVWRLCALASALERRGGVATRPFPNTNWSIESRRISQVRPFIWRAGIAPRRRSARSVGSDKPIYSAASVALKISRGTALAYTACARM